MFWHGTIIYGPFEVTDCIKAIIFKGICVNGRAHIAHTYSIYAKFVLEYQEIFAYTVTKKQDEIIIKKDAAFKT